jgi:hypothetical protein
MLLTFGLIGATGISASSESPHGLPNTSAQFTNLAKFEPEAKAGSFVNYDVRAVGVTNLSTPYMLDVQNGNFCNQLSADCLKANTKLHLVGYLGECNSLNQLMCVSEISAVLPDETKIPAKIIGNAKMVSARTLDPEELEQLEPDVSHQDSANVGAWQGSSKSGLPSSETGPLLFEIPGISNASGTTTYSLNANYHVAAIGFRKQIPSSVRYERFESVIQPYLREDKSGARPLINRIRKQGNFYAIASSGAYGDAAKFAWVEDGAVGLAAGFPEKVRLEVVYQLPAKIGGWFHGRLNSPNVDVSPINANINRVTVSADPVKVQITRALHPLFTSKGDALFKTLGIPAGTLNVAKQYEARGSLFTTGRSWVPAAGTNEFLKVEKYLPAKPLGEGTVWYFSSIGGGSTNTCLNRTDRLQGLVSTNAMTYDSGAPKFENGYLNYRVGGQHLTSSGEVFAGTYDLTMRSDLARCLYKLSNLPISATISVLGDAGNTAVATTTVTEANGWLVLSAKNFSFSRKTIKARFKYKK